MAYIGYERSERSQEAINNGLLIKSELQAWQKRAVEAGAVSACEWHHTGKMYNETYYYNPQDFEDLNKKDFPPIKKEKVTKTADEIWYVLVSADWGGTKRHPSIVGANVNIKNKLSNTQKWANKYNQYGGYIREFNNQKDAIEFAKTAKLEQ